MSRPVPRKSALSGTSPVAPAADLPEATSGNSVEMPRSAPAPLTKRRGDKGAKPKVSFYQDRENTDRARGAILHTMVQEGNRNLSQFIDKAVMAEVERLERKYNGGKPFPPLGSGELPTGRAAAEE